MSAHADVKLIEGSFNLAPGEELVVPTALHYHRLAIRYLVDGSGDGSISLRVLLGSEAQASPEEEQTMVSATLASKGSLSRLIACCDGVTYQQMRLVLRNEGGSPAALEIRAWAVHDDFAVVATRTETGAATVPAALFGMLGVGAWGAVRNRRRRPGGASPTAARRALRASTALFLASLIAAGTLGVAGMARYGGGPVDGLIVVMADLPIPGGPFGARGALAMGVLLLAWLAATGLWYAAVAAGAAGDAAYRDPTMTWTVRLGAALALTSLAGGVMMGASYGSWVPPTLAALLVAPVSMVLATIRRSAGPVAAAGDLRAG